MTIQEAKEKYNALLKRFNKAEQYFDREDIFQEVKEEQLENFETILKGLEFYLSKILVFTDQEMLEGFKIG